MFVHPTNISQPAPAHDEPQTFRRFAMPASTSAPVADFSWLLPSCRPSPEEVETYVALINEVEHTPPEFHACCLREAELQLWIWRNEARQHAPQRRRRARAAAAAASA
jgi:hypothetical protein